jgi:hypothetical protein
MPVTLSVLNPARLVPRIVALVSRRIAAAASGWCPAPLEPDDHILRDIGKTRDELTGFPAPMRADERLGRMAIDARKTLQASTIAEHHSV